MRITFSFEVVLLDDCYPEIQKINRKWLLKHNTYAKKVNLEPSIHLLV